MGISKKSTMTLLTSLAALIIIVHCVEEDLDNDYQHEIRPRILETRKSTYDESWRTREAASTLQRPQNTDDWKDVSPDEPLKRRRPGRKRKRRPQTGPIEELIQQEEISYPNEPLRPYHDFESEKNRDFIEEPTLRRKKPEEKPIQWADNDFTALEKPHRRRTGPRRNRPALQRAPESNEFRQNADIHQDVAEVKVASQDIVRTSLDQVHHGNIFENTPEITDEITKDIKSENKFDFKVPTSETVTDEQISGPQMTEDKSLSEFSMENVKKPGALRHKFKFPRRHKIINPSLMQDHDIEKENVDPITLKDILKRSNGSSLSEILQQHNLSLTDLLQGKEEAVSIFKNLESTEDHRNDPSEIVNPITDKQIETKIDVKDESDEPALIKSETKYTTEPVSDTVTEYVITTEATQAEHLNEKEIEGEPTTAVKPLIENTTKIRRRFPLGLRKKLRMKPMVNVSTTQKAQLSRDLITLNNRKYTQLRRNTTKSKEWRDVITNKKQNTQEDNTNTTTAPETTTQQITLEETTIPVELVNKIKSLEEPQPNINLNLADIEMDVTETISPVTETTTEVVKNITEKSLGVVTMTRPTAVSLGLRRTALNNRLKRKRLKQKNSTTESPQDDLLKNLYGMGNLVSSSEFIAKTQPPSTTLDDSKDFTTIQDFMTTESIKTTIDDVIQTETTMFINEMIPSTTVKTTTLEPAKMEMEEILNDTHILSKLSEILKERNMTLEELIAHRERGSSRIHLADIFHNNSRETNPPEPFLTKSLLEPISKETYPLRVLLDANLHDPNGKISAIDDELRNNLNIPIVMDFGNNVNENAENMGIMSLFNNYTKNITKIMLPATNNTNANILDNIPNVTSTIETARESRVLENNKDDVVNWNEILSLMSTAKTNEKEVSEILLDTPFKKLALEDIDEDGLLALEDLQRLKDLDKPMESELNGNIELNFANTDPELQEKGFLDNIPSQTTSITVATASIVGLGMILFLLTYIAFKCKNQRSMTRKKASFSEERIPTPVFETRIGHKNNSSIRSISPMIQPSNIYSVNTLDSHNCDESGEYIWDSMRQPYQ